MGKYSNASQRTHVGVSSTFVDDWVYVDKSKFLHSMQIKGFGLYANKSFKKGDVIIEYKGKIITNTQANQKIHHRNYMFDVRDGDKVLHVIDSANNKYSSAAKFVNSTTTWNDKQRNAEFIQFDRKIFLVASKTVTIHSEILAFYGPNTHGVINET